MVEVCQSSLPGSGEGLRVKTDVEEGVIVAYYHGLRMKAKDENPFGPPTGYGIFLEWDRDKRETSDVLDLSPEVTTEAINTFLVTKIKMSFFPDAVHEKLQCYVSS